MMSSVCSTDTETSADVVISCFISAGAVAGAALDVVAVISASATFVSPVTSSIPVIGASAVTAAAAAAALAAFRTAHF